MFDKFNFVRKTGNVVRESNEQLYCRDSVVDALTIKFSQSTRCQVLTHLLFLNTLDFRT